MIKELDEKQIARSDEFTKWWGRDGRMFDPDTEDVPWFDKREALAEYAWNAAMHQSEEMRGQLRRIIEADSSRDARLRGQTAWHPFVNPERPDWLAWRECAGGREILTYNNALCDPITITFEPEQPAPRERKGKFAFTPPSGDNDWWMINDMERMYAVVSVQSSVPDAEKITQFAWDKIVHAEQPAPAAPSDVPVHTLVNTGKSIRWVLESDHIAALAEARRTEPAPTPHPAGDVLRECMAIFNGPPDQPDGNGMNAVIKIARRGMVTLEQVEKVVREAARLNYVSAYPDEAVKFFRARLAPKQEQKEDAN